MTPTREKRSMRAWRILASTAYPSPDMGHAEDDLEEQMPRPQSKARVINPILLARPSDVSSSAVLDRPDPSDSGESRDSKKSRSRSPTRRLGAIQFAEIPVDSRARDRAVIPTDLQELVMEMEQIGERIGVVPPAVREKFEGIGKTIHDFQCAKESVTGIEGENQLDATDRATGGLGHDLSWFLATRIHQASHGCLEKAAPGAAWNSEVHSRVLRLALEGHWQGHEIWYEDISSARISNKTGVPWNVATETMQSKMVDYAIVINPSQEFTKQPSKSLRNHIIERLRGEAGDPSIN